MSRSDGSQVDLTNCDQEPIHQLGAIQGFGCLIAATPDWHVAFRSANCTALLQSSQPIEIGDRLDAHFAPLALESLRQLLGSLGSDSKVERVFGIVLFGHGTLFDVALHRSGRLSVIEIEPHDSRGFISHLGALQAVMERLEGTSGVSDLCAIAAADLKKLLGFDRVMVYRFHPDLSGEVIAEAREPQLEAYLNLRYPKTDIPDQARRLYLRNRFRIISDVDAEPIAIEPQTDLDGSPLDLSLSTLRAVSPIHIEYLQNMGVGASLSISIVIDGKLWGLFACHHYSPRVLSYSLRTVAELFSQLFSLRLDLAIVSGGSQLAERARQMRDRLMTRLVGGHSLAENLGTIGAVIGELVTHDGSSAYIEGTYTSQGIAPSEEEFLTILPALNGASAGQVVHSDALAVTIPAAAAFVEKVAGALIIPVSRRPRDYVVLWRRELPQTVTWAGNPEKPMEYGPNGPRLTPRKSFEAWQESVRGRSAPWTPGELAMAESLRITLLEVILRMTDDAMTERDRAQQQQELLIAELNHRVRNILTLIRGLVSQSRGEASDIEGFAQLIGGRIQSLAMAHDNITRENWSPTSLRKLIKAEAEAYLSGKTERITFEGPDVLIDPKAYTVLALVLHEMMTNSAKYGSLCDSSGSVALTTTLGPSGELAIAWRERGGPPVKPPQERGFGTTIIEKSVPYELRGTAEVRYEVSGLEADFMIPARFIHGLVPPESEQLDQLQSAAHSAGDGDNGALLPIFRQGPVLVVEDSMIIAMETEEGLHRLGVKKVVVAASVAGALAEIAAEPPLFALLDYNLGSETSEPVADRLVTLNIPFWFVTGYGEAVSQLSGSKALGVLQKPYSRQDLLRALTSSEDKSGEQQPA